MTTLITLLLCVWWDYISRNAISISNWINIFDYFYTFI